MPPQFYNTLNKLDTMLSTFATPPLPPTKIATAHVSCNEDAIFEKLQNDMAHPSFQLFPDALKSQMYSTLSELAAKSTP
jgi:hypothetical protein